MLDADWIVLGPGSWFTSVIPHLLVPELAEAIHDHPGPADPDPQPRTGRGDGRVLSAARHIELLAEHAPDLRLDVVLADRASPPTTRTWPTGRRRSAPSWWWPTSLRATARPGTTPLRLASAYAEIMGI